MNEKYACIIGTSGDANPIAQIGRVLRNSGIKTKCEVSLKGVDAVPFGEIAQKKISILNHASCIVIYLSNNLIYKQEEKGIPDFAIEEAKERGVPVVLIKSGSLPSSFLVPKGFPVFSLDGILNGGFEKNEFTDEVRNASGYAVVTAYDTTAEKMLTKNYVFISYSTKDQKEADSVMNLLRKNGIRTWMAPGNIPPGKKYAEVITQALKGCSCLLLILSKHAQDSIWVAKEVERAVSMRKTVVSLCIDDLILNDEFELYLSTDQIVAVNKIDEKSTEIKRVISALKGCLGE